MEPSALNATTLRLALGLRGGVSLAVWIGGAVAELDAFRHARGGQDDYYSKLLAVGRYDSVEIDVMSGASAGGLNAVLAAAAMIGGTSTEGLQRTWLCVAGLRDLLDSDAGPPKKRSLLNGTYFLEQIERSVGSLLPAAGAAPVLGHRLEVFLSGTVLDGLPVRIVDDEFSSEEASRAGAFFHFRHLGGTSEVSDFVDGAVAPLSRAARTTASFPTAFEPVPYPVAANEDTGEADVDAQMRGRLHLGGTPRTRRVRLLDGGVVDNIPVARALRGLPSVPADNATDRWLIYMQPSPDPLPIVRPAAPADPDDDVTPGFARVIGGIVGGFMSESILDDVEVLRDHNFAAIEARRAWAASIGRLPDAPSALDEDRCAADDAATTPMRAVDAARLMALLLDPSRELLWKPIGRSVPTSPLGAPGVTFADSIRDAIAAHLPGGRPARPFAALARSAAVLTRWALAAEGTELERMNRHDLADLSDTAALQSRSRLAAIGEHKRCAYQLMHLAQLLASVVDWSVVCAAREPLIRSDGSDAQRDLPTTVARRVVDQVHASTAELAQSTSIIELVAALPIAGSSLGFATSDETHGALLRTLHRLEVPDHARPADSGAPELVGRMWARLAEVTVGLSEFALAPDGPHADGVLEELAERLRGLAHPEPAAEAYLRLIDRHTTGVHAGHAVGLAGQIKYLRIGGSNMSPLCFSDDEFAFDGPRFRGVLSSPHGDEVPAKLKLSGSDLANFSAFVSQRWRQNDWMWGRLDAAKSMVDVVCGADRLPADHAHALASIRAAVLAPMSLPAEISTAWGEQLGGCVERLWDRYEATIASELRAAPHISGSARLRTTKRVLVLRRQWEILANELPAFADASLEPVEPTVRLGDALPAPTTTMDDAVVAYERADRSFGSVWGRYWLTALGIRTGYAIWAATPPQRRWARWLRAPLKPLPVTLLAVALARNRGLLAVSVAINVIVMPRLNGIGGLAAWAAATATSALLAWTFRGRPARPDAHPPRLRSLPYERGGPVFVALAGLACAYGLVVQRSTWWRGRLATHPRWDLITSWSRLIDWYTVTSAAAGLVAAGLLWYCARWPFRLVSTLIIGFIAGFWTVFSRWSEPSGHGVAWWRRAASSLEFAFGSMVWALVAALTLTTAITHYAFRKRLPIARYD